MSFEAFRIILRLKLSISKKHYNSIIILGFGKSGTVWVFSGNGFMSEGLMKHPKNETEVFPMLDLA